MCVWNANPAHPQSIFISKQYHTSDELRISSVYYLLIVYEWLFRPLMNDFSHKCIRPANAYAYNNDSVCSVCVLPKIHCCLMHLTALYAYMYM